MTDTELPTSEQVAQERWNALDPEKREPFFVRMYAVMLELTKKTNANLPQDSPK